LQGLESAFVNKRLQTHYIPNLNEWLVSLWVVSLGLLTFLLGTRWLPVVTANRGGWNMPKNKPEHDGIKLFETPWSADNFSNVQPCWVDRWRHPVSWRGW